MGGQKYGDDDLLRRGERMRIISFGGFIDYQIQLANAWKRKTMVSSNKLTYF
jgi:hypothetical protein